VENPWKLNREHLQQSKGANCELPLVVRCRPFTCSTAEASLSFFAVCSTGSGSAGS